MTIRFYDISRTLFPDMAVWPGDTPFEIHSTGSMATGDSANVTGLSLSAHTGTHVDAPSHFTEDGLTAERIDPAIYWGAAQVVSANKRSGPLTPDDFAGYDLGGVPRLLVRSHAGSSDPRVFAADFAYPSPELADYLAGQGVILFGTDAPSVDATDSESLPGHHALQRNGIFILEGLDLSGVPDGYYELVALPLKIQGGDGSPVRAVLRGIEGPS